jgi:hypothetical protein
MVNRIEYSHAQSTWAHINHIKEGTRVRPKRCWDTRESGFLYQTGSFEFYVNSQNSRVHIQRLRPQSVVVSGGWHVPFFVLEIVP